MLARVEGRSMQPRLQPGDFVLSLAWLPVRVGDIVLVRAELGLLVKEVAGVSAERLDLRGWGYVPRTALIGRVVVLSWPRLRA